MAKVLGGFSLNLLGAFTVLEVLWKYIRAEILFK
jgi:hypothetical protein